MNTKKYKIYAALLGVFLALAACQPEEFAIGEILSTDNLEYSITQNADDPNMIFLESITPGVTPLWQTPMGRSTRVKDTVKIPFAGDYAFIYGVESAGGYVQSDTFNLTLTTNNLMYVNDPLWTLLSGGVGNSKTWLLDIDAEGVSKYWKGPLYFSSDTWRWNNTCEEGSEDCWIWEADWPGNTWVAAANDYGTMTFNLIGGANVHVEHMNSPNRGVENGVYFLDAEAKTLKMTDAAPLMNDWADGANIDDWSFGYVISLTEEAMQIGYKDKGKDEFIIFNYISKEYADNWVPEDVPDPEPTLPDGWMDDISKTVNTTITWKLSESNPLDWAKLDGSLMNGWENPEDYPDWLGTPDPSVYGDFTMTMNSADETVVFITPDGTETSGTYSLDEKGIYSFDITVPTFSVISWASFAADANNQLRILKIEKDAGGSVTGMWVGALSSEKPEYMAYHLIPSSNENGGSSEPEGTELAFDNSKLAFGDIEGNGNFRLELYNDFGSTKDDPPLVKENIVFNNRIEITFTLQGITFSEGASGSYNTALSYADADWAPQYWGDGSSEEVASVTGDGTYTIWCEPGAASEGAAVFVIDIKEMAAEIADLSAVTATIDKITMY
ncbi:hypothetical protein GM418_15805 [Maribellus comscasis]|uniref:Uncharacterized protein n=1 Tax=Maribellus comscasis TaxID=2681766 RepID=A0A6I6JUY4_9BACT|nr:hypothetical protein [Maribellus comscasis]QGY45079.1 hypothetical protein GM418_15805 [Maribellus comscasis]